MITLSVVVLLGAATVSCEKQVPDKELTARVSQGVHNDLVEAMASDELVQDQFTEDGMFLKGYVIWFSSLTNAQREARIQELEASIQSGNSISDPSHTEAETQAYHTLQTSRWAEISQKYSQINDLTSSGLNEVLIKVIDKIDDNEPAEILNGCMSGYRACIQMCRRHFHGTNLVNCANSCYAGAMACIHSTVPAHP